MKINRFTRTDHGLDLQADAGVLRIEAMNEHIIHVVYANRPAPPPAKSPIVIQPSPAPVRWDTMEGLETITFQAPELAVEINRQTGAFTWKDKNGALLVREPERGGKSLREARSGVPGAVSTRLDFVFSDGEAIYGLGQHEEGVYNYRGHSQFLYQHNLKVAMPVIVSTRGYAILFDTCSLANFHDDQYGSYFWTEVDDAMDFYFLYGPEFDRLVAGIRWLTGQVPLLPRWAYGYIQSKERYKRQSELVEIVQEYRRRGIGLDCIVQDWMSWPGNLWGQKSLDPDRFPDPARLTQDLHALNARLMVSIWPRFNNDGPDQVVMRDNGFLLGDGQTYDAFNPGARALYWKQASEGLFRHGIDAWWCDCSEPFEPDWRGAVKPEPWQRMVDNTTEFKRYLDPRMINAYSLLHARGMYEGQRSSGSEKRVVNLTRSASPGQARYGTVTWSGDITASWETLRRQIPAGLNFTVTGSPRWTFDIGGFFADRRPDQWYWDGDYPNGCEDRGFRELYARWFQVATFLPMFRAHGTDTPREVWRFGRPGETAYDTLVKFIRLRYRLLPYIYSLAAAETFHSDTMLRSLAFDFRRDPNVHEIADEFLFGRAFLVCPVLWPMYYEANSEPLAEVLKERTVYLPEGSSWYNFWTGKRYAGGQILRTAAPLEIVPLFVRAGTILPLGPEVQHAGEKRSAPLELRVYPGEDGQFNLYDDEGDSYRYEQGEYSWTSLSWQQSTRTLTVGPRKGSFRGMAPKQVFRVVMSGAGLEHGETVGELDISGSETARWTAN
jgi:alpha-D-xyloside xylohydrolase